MAPLFLLAIEANEQIIAKILPHIVELESSVDSRYLVEVCRVQLKIILQILFNPRRYLQLWKHKVRERDFPASATLAMSIPAKKCAF